MDNVSTFILYLFIGVILSYLLPVEYLLWKIEMWYKNKYGRYTKVDGRNYIQVFHTPIEVKDV